MRKRWSLRRWKSCSRLQTSFACRIWALLRQKIRIILRIIVSETKSWEGLQLQFRVSSLQSPRSGNNPLPTIRAKVLGVPDYPRVMIYLTVLPLHSYPMIYTVETQRDLIQLGCIFIISPFRLSAGKYLTWMLALDSTKRWERRKKKWETKNINKSEGDG